MVKIKEKCLEDCIIKAISRVKLIELFFVFSLCVTTNNIDNGRIKRKFNKQFVA